MRELKAFLSGSGSQRERPVSPRVGRAGDFCHTIFFIQAGYIHKGVIAASVGVFALILVLMEGAARLDEEMLWSAAACVPFLAMLAAAEGARSRRWGMDELELAAPFPCGQSGLPEQVFWGFSIWPGFFLARLLSGGLAGEQRCRPECFS